MAKDNTGSAKPAEWVPGSDTPGPVEDGRVWGLTSKDTRGTSGSGTTANGKGSDFNC